MAMPPFPDLMNNVAFRDLPADIASHIANFQECPALLLLASHPALSASVVLNTPGYQSGRVRRKPPSPDRARIVQ